jgi:predicted GH43/DUF377 family glycosyl hydrolase
LFDVARSEGSSGRRSVKEYLALAPTLMASNVDLHIFVEEHLHDDVVALSVDRPAELLTVIEPMRIQDLPQWALSQKMRVGLETGAIRRTSSTLNSVKDTATACAVWWSKLDLVARALDRGTHDGAWWIDIGIAHTSSFPAAGLATLGDPESPTFGIVHSDTQDELELVEFLQKGIPRVAGGVIGLPKSRLSELRILKETLINTAVDNGLFVNEESIYSLMIRHMDARLIVTTWSSILDDFSRQPIKENAKVFHSPGVEPENDFMALYKVSKKVHLPDPSDDLLKSMNPTIARRNDSGFVSLVRQVNYCYENGVYVRLDGSDVIRTSYNVVRLNDDLEIISSALLDDSAIRMSDPKFPVHGIEDLRIFRRGEKWFASGTVREHRFDGLCQIMLAEIVDIDSERPALVNGVLLPTMSPKKHEKNWMPIEGEEHAWVWGVDPTVVLRLDQATQSLVPSRSAKGNLQLRGSSQVIQFSGGWIAVVHEVVPSTTNRFQRSYQHRFVRWNDDFTDSKISEAFHLANDKNGLEFCAGLAPSVRPNHLVMSYGVGDRSAEVVEFQIPTMWSA